MKNKNELICKGYQLQKKAITLLQERVKELEETKCMTCRNRKLCELGKLHEAKKVEMKVEITKKETATRELFGYGPYVSCGI